MSDDWTKLFGTIDVGLGGISSSTPQPSPTQRALAPRSAPMPSPPSPSMPQSSMPAPPPPGSAPQQVAPGVFQMAASFGTSMAKFAAGGFRTTGTELHQKRLAVCDDCGHRSGTNCILCGCILPLKAKMPHEHCPIGKWPG